MKHLLRSFALGLLTATSIIGIYYYFIYEQEIPEDTARLSEAEMIVELEAAGYYIYEDDPLEDVTVPALSDDDLEEPIDGFETDEDDTESADEEPDLEDEDEDETGDPDLGNSDHEVILITIEPGMSISTVSDMLVDENLIDNRDDFINYLSENNYGTNIQIGEFELNQNLTLAEVVDIVARQNN